MVKNESWDVIRFAEEEREIALVKGGRGAYLWIGERRAIERSRYDHGSYEHFPNTEEEKQ